MQSIKSGFNPFFCPLKSKTKSCLRKIMAEIRQIFVLSFTKQKDFILLRKKQTQITPKARKKAQKNALRSRAKKKRKKAQKISQFWLKSCLKTKNKTVYSLKNVTLCQLVNEEQNRKTYKIKPKNQPKTSHKKTKKPKTKRTKKATFPQAK